VDSAKTLVALAFAPSVPSVQVLRVSNSYYHFYTTELEDTLDNPDNGTNIGQRLVL